MAVGAGSLEVIRGTFDGPTTGILLGGMVSMNLRLSTFGDCYEAVALGSASVTVIEENDFRGMMANAIRISLHPFQTEEGHMTLNRNVFSGATTWDLTLCGFDGSEDASDWVVVTGSGNESRSVAAKLCPADGNWPSGLFESADD